MSPEFGVRREAPVCHLINLQKTMRMFFVGAVLAAMVWGAQQGTAAKKAPAKSSAPATKGAPAKQRTAQTAKPTSQATPHATGTSHAAPRAGTAARSTTTARSTAARKGGSRTAASRMTPRTTWRNRQTVPTPDRYREIQQALVAKGYLKPEDATGTWGDSSTDALKRFQAEQSLDATGKINALSLIALGLGPKRDTPAVQPPKPATAPQVPDGSR